MSLPNPPPVDPATQARQRAAAAEDQNSHYRAMAAMAGQFLLSFIAGAWAAGIADDGSETIGIYTGVACVFALAGALAASRSAQFAVGGVMALFGLPAFIRKVTTAPLEFRTTPDPAQERQEWWLHAIATGVHACALLVLFLLVAAAVAFYSGASFIALALRFALGAAVVSLLSWQALKLDI